MYCSRIGVNEVDPKHDNCWWTWTPGSAELAVSPNTMHFWSSELCLKGVNFGLCFLKFCIIQGRFSLDKSTQNPSCAGLSSLGSSIILNTCICFYHRWQGSSVDVTSVPKPMSLLIPHALGTHCPHLPLSPQSEFSVPANCKWHFIRWKCESGQWRRLRHAYQKCIIRWGLDRTSCSCCYPCQANNE